MSWKNENEAMSEVNIPSALPRKSLSRGTEWTVGFVAKSGK